MVWGRFMVDLGWLSFGLGWLRVGVGSGVGPALSSLFAVLFSRCLLFQLLPLSSLSGPLSCFLGVPAVPIVLSV